MDNTRYVISHGKRIAVETLEIPALSKRRKRTEPFIMVPLGWAIRATEATRTPKALVWIRLLHLAWKQKTRTLLLPNKWLEDQGVSRFTKNHALDELETSGLIAVERRHRKSPRITLL